MLSPRTAFSPSIRAALLVGAMLFPGSATAADYTAGSVAIGNPWARATPKGASVAAAYMTLTNNGTSADRLISGTVTVAGRFEVHTMEMVDGVAKMRPVEGGLVLKPGETVKLEPGGMHVMLVGLKQPLQQGTTMKGTLVFEHAGTVEIEYAVQPIGQGAPMPDHGGGHEHQH
jgi:copper(I)-binding protein